MNVNVIRYHDIIYIRKELKITSTDFIDIAGIIDLEEKLLRSMRSAKLVDITFTIIIICDPETVIPVFFPPCILGYRSLQ